MLLAAALGSIDGVFVEIDRYDWYRVVQSKSVTEIVIANIKGYDAEDCLKGCPKYDQAKALIDAARPGMKIYVGLRYDKNFQIDAAKGAKESEIGWEFWNLLSPDQKRRVKGWYIAGEWHNESGKAEAIRKYLEAATMNLPPGEVLVAPFFVVRGEDKCTKALSAPETAAMFKKILAETKVTRLLLQDGFGARDERACKFNDSDDSYQAAAKLYIDEIAKAMPKNKNGVQVVFGIDLEAFGDLGPHQRRLDLQFALVPKGAPVIVYEHRACCVTGLCQ